MISALMDSVHVCIMSNLVSNWTSHAIARAVIGQLHFQMGVHVIW